MKRRWLSLLLALCMILSLFPVSAFAVSEEGASYEAGGFEEGEDVADDNFDDGDEGEGMTYFDAYAEQSDFWVAPGETPTLTVEIDTDGDLSQVAYQWGQYAEEVDEESGEVESRFVPFDGATAESYTVDPVASGQYICVVTAPDGGSREISFHVYVENNLSVEWADNVINRVEPGDSAYLAVEVDGIDLSLVTYQWYVDQGDRMDAIEGATESSFTTGPITDTTFYRCAVDDGFGGSDYSDFRVYIENHFRAEALGPENVGVALGSTAELAVEVSGNDLSGVTYQWYHLEDVTYTEDPEEEGDEPYTYTEREWVKIDGETGDTFTTGAITELQEFRCEVQDRYQNLESVDFNVNVDNHFELEPVGDPDRYAQPGETLELQVAASADDLDGVTYQWYVLDDEGEWNLLDVTGDVCTTEPVDGYIRYVCTAKDAFDSTRDVWFYIHVDNEFNAWAEDGEEILTSAGDRAMLSVAVSGNNLDRVTYQWYHLETLEAEEDGEVYTYKNYVLLPDETESQLETAAITERNQYSCTVKDGFGNEAEVQFVVLPDNHFTVERVGDENLYLNPNQSADLAVNVQADDTTGMKLEWWGNEEVEHDSYTSTDWVLLAEGTDNFITPNLTESQDYLFRATDRYGTVHEIWFYVHVNNNFVLNPVGDTEIKVAANEWTEMQVEAGGEDLTNVTYQWYHVVTNEAVDDDGEIYTQTLYYAMDGETGSSCSVMASAGREQYACRAWDGYGSEREVQFWVYMENHFEAHAANDRHDFYVPQGDTAELQVEVTCDDPSNLTYTWYLESRSITTSSEGSWEFDYNTVKLEETGNTLTTDPVDYRVCYYCHVEDGYGNSQDVWFYTYVQNRFYLDFASGSGDVQVPYGETAALQVVAHGNNTDDVRYKWYRVKEYLYTSDDGESWWSNDWQILNGETGDCITTEPATEFIKYYCEAVDRYGNTSGYWFNVRVDNGFSARQANGNSDVYVQPGEPLDLQVLVSGNNLDGVTYQWYIERPIKTYEPDGTIEYHWQTEKLDGETGDTCSLASVDCRASYYCEVVDSFGNRENVWFYVYVDNPFTVESADGEYHYQVAPGESRELQVTVSGDEVYDADYQWYRVDHVQRIDSEGNPYISDETHLIYGATQSSYTAGPIDSSTSFYCRVTDRYQNDRDCWFSLGIDNGFHAEQVGDSSVYVTLGETATLQVTAAANDPSGITYQWYREDLVPFTEDDGSTSYNSYTVRLDGETNDSLTTDPVTEHCQYYCHVQDGYGNYDNLWFSVYVDNQLQVERVGSFERPALPGESATLQVMVSASDLTGLTYQWSKEVHHEGINADGEYYNYWDWTPVGDNSDTYVTDAITEATYYRCFVTDQYNNSAECDFRVYADNSFSANALNWVQDFYVAPGETQQLEVVAQANVTDRMTYQWYHLEQVEYHEDDNSWTEDNWVALEGANQNVLTTDAIQNREQYYCRVEDGFGNWDNVHFWIHVENHFSTEGLGGYYHSAAPGESVTLEVDAHADQGPLTYQWYWQEPIKHVEEDGSTWTERTEKKLDGKTDPVIQTLPLSVNGEEYYCRVSDPYGNTASVWFCLEMDNRLEANPVNGENTVYTKPGETALLEVEASAVQTDKLTYQWNILKEVEYTDEDSGETRTEWKLVPIEGETGPTFRTPEISYYTEYACRVDDGYGSFRNVWMNVRVDNGFQAERVGDREVYVDAGDTATLQVNASTTDDSVLTYQWNVMGFTTTILEDGSMSTTMDWYTYDDINSDTLTLRTGGEIVYEDVICNVSDPYGNRESIWFRICEDNHLSAERVGENPYYVPYGEPVTLTANVTATDMTGMGYSWYIEKPVTYSYPDATWTQMEYTPIEGANTNTLAIESVTSQTVYEMRVFDRYGNGQSVFFEVTPSHIIRQPADVSGGAGDTVTTSVAVEGMEDSLHYQWQMFDGEFWADIEGQNDPTCTLTLIPEMAMHDLRCVITNEEAELCLYSDPAAISVDLGSVYIAQQPADCYVGIGNDAVFHVDAEGEDLTYQWQYKAPAGSWKNSPAEGSGTDTLTVPATAGRNHYQYRCLVMSGDLSVPSEAATLTVFGIKSQPAPVSAKAGQTVTMSVAAVGTDLTYQWQYQKDDGTWANTTLSGNKTDTLTIPATLARNGNLYRCVVTGGDLQAASESAKLTVLGIKTQPASVSAVAGEKVTMSVGAAGENLTYQWQYQKADGTWANTTLAGCNTDTLTIPATLGRSGNLYRCLVTSGDLSVTSNGALLTVFGIKTQPADVCAGLGSTVTMKVAAAGENLTYQWQYLKADGTWANTTLTGCKTDTLSIKATAARNGNQYRCVVTSGDLTIASNAATLTVFTITAQPEDSAGTVGGSATFKVTATGDNLTYQWQYKTPTGSWKNTTASGNKTPTLTVPITAGRDGYQYRCAVKSGDQTLNSEAATLRVLSIKTQPADVSAGLGATATMKVVATGENLTYQWQYKSPAGSWKNTTLSGCRTDTLSITATSGRNGYQYRCVVKMGDLTVESEGAKLTVIPIQITAQPKDFTGAAGDIATFTVKATGDSLTYQWQYSENGGSTWKNSTNKSAVATVSISAKRDGRLYRCVLTDADGNQLISDTALLTWVPVKITVQPADYSGDVGDTAVFAVAAQGDMLTYQWQFSDNGGKTWTNSSSKQFTASCKINEARDGRLYRCIVSDGTGYSVTSDPAKVILTHSDIQITQQPVNYTGAIDETAKFKVVATGTGLKYQWKYTDDGVNWKSSSSTSNTVTCKITAARDGRLYRCIITDANGSTRTTSIAKIIVK